MNRFPLFVLLVALAIIVVIAWEPARQYVGLLSVSSSPLPAASPSPTAEPTPSPTPERTLEEVAAESQLSAADKCMDGSALTVTARDESQVSYKCESGAIGARLKQ